MPYWIVTAMHVDVKSEREQESPVVGLYTTKEKAVEVAEECFRESCNLDDDPDDSIENYREETDLGTIRYVTDADPNFYYVVAITDVEIEA